MIVVSFFSAKGGTGKTTFNMSMASFLKYHLGKAVIVLDADTPEYNLNWTTNAKTEALMNRRCTLYGKCWTLLRKE